MSGLVWLVCAGLFYGLIVPIRMVCRAVYYAVYTGMLIGGAYFMYCAASGFGQGFFNP